MSTTMGACFGGCTALVVSLIYYKIKEGKVIWDLGPCCNGALTGESCCNFCVPPFRCPRGCNGALSGVQAL